MKGVHWARPKLVAQVGFSEWTPDGKLRHPRYLGLRDDKRPKQVVRERAEESRERGEFALVEAGPHLPAEPQPAVLVVADQQRPEPGA